MLYPHINSIYIVSVCKCVIWMTDCIVLCKCVIWMTDCIVLYRLGSRVNGDTDHKNDAFL